jgi:protein-disulfide isomerase
LLIACSSGQTQSTTDIVQLQRDIAVLKKEIGILLQQQNQILGLLTEMKQDLAGTPIPNDPTAVPGSVSISGSPFRGSDSARVAIVEFGDFECPYCGKFWREVYPLLIQNYVTTGRVKYVYRDLPLSVHPHSFTAALAGRCAGEQERFWEMHDSLFANQARLSETDLLARARPLGLDAVRFEDCFRNRKYVEQLGKDVSDASRMGVRSTPAFLLGVIESDGTTVTVKTGIKGAQPYPAFQALLDEVLAPTGQ